MPEFLKLWDMFVALISELFRKIWRMNTTWETAACCKARDQEVLFHFAHFQILLLFCCCKLAEGEPSSMCCSGYIALLCNKHSSHLKTSFVFFCHMHVQVLCRSVMSSEMRDRLIFMLFAVAHRHFPHILLPKNIA